MYFVIQTGVWKTLYLTKSRLKLWLTLIFAGIVILLLFWAHASDFWSRDLCSLFFLSSESVMKSGDKTKVLFLSKLKLMDWERTDRVPEIISRPEVEMVTGGPEVTRILYHSWLTKNFIFFNYRDQVDDYGTVPVLECIISVLDPRVLIRFGSGLRKKNIKRQKKWFQLAPFDNN